jgi:hypothetical protein
MSAVPSWGAWTGGCRGSSRLADALGEAVGGCLLAGFREEVECRFCFGVQVRLHDPSLLSELTLHFERSGFRVQRMGDALDVDRDDAPDEAHAAREILAHLTVWTLMNPDSVADS